VAHYLGEVNALHPFREGNGRAQRAFFGQLARDAGFTLAWQHLDPARNVDASAAITRGDPEPMREMLNELTRGQHLTITAPPAARSRLHWLFTQLKAISACAFIIRCANDNDTDSASGSWPEGARQAESW
jgi:hypothetical protein